MRQMAALRFPAVKHPPAPALISLPCGRSLVAMRNTILIAMALTMLASPTLVVPASADTYPVSGRWGQSSSSEKGPIDCSRLRVISFNGDERTDSNGGVPAYRNKSISAAGSAFRVVDEFTTGQIRNGKMNYTLTQTDADHIEMNMKPGGLLKLQRCK
jgi:hypothetical protein